MSTIDRKKYHITIKKKDLMTFDSVATVKTQNNRNPVLLGCFYFPQNLQILLPKINIRLTLSVSQT